MHCFASENQTYTGKWLFGVESWKSLKGQENLLLKNLLVKTRVENVRFLSWRIFFVGKYGIQSTNEMAFKRTVTLRASFRFPAIRFDAPTLLSFSGFTHAHAKCPPVPYTRFIYTLYTPYIHPVYPLMHTLYTVYTLCTPVIYTLRTSYLTLYAAYLHGIYALYTPNIQLLYVL